MLSFENTLFQIISRCPDYSDNCSVNRKRYDDFIAGMLSKLDESVGQVVEALRKKGMLKNSVIVFSTDNGGPPAGFNLNAASNWPLRGTKNTLWEGITERALTCI